MTNNKKNNSKKLNSKESKISNNVNEEIIVEKTNENSPSISVEKTEIQQLKEMVLALTNQNRELLKEKENHNDNLTSDNATRMIKVISLCSNKMYLSQYDRGQGKIYVFNKLGTSKSVPANILDDIVSTHYKLAEEGYFYICDEKFVREHGLDSNYEIILKPEIFNDILKQNKNDLRDILENCNAEQFNTIIDVIKDKVINKEITLDELEESGKILILDKVIKEKQQLDEYSFIDDVNTSIELLKPREKNS